MRLRWVTVTFFWFCDAARRGLKRKARVVSTPLRSPEFPREISPGYIISGKSDNNRYVEKYTLNGHAFPYQRELMEGISIIAKRDELFDSFTPRNFTSLTELTPFGNYQLQRKISGSTQSAIFTVAGMPNVLLKYQLNCIELREAEFSGIANGSVPTHPLILDYMLLRLAQPSGVVPIANFLSPAGEPCPRRNQKCHFGMTDYQFEFCRENYASLRYMVMEQVRGTDLHRFKSRYTDGAVPVPIALIVAISLIDALEKIHSHSRVIHGDIHLGNIIVNDVDMESETAEIFLIDFGRGSLNGERPNRPVRRTTHWNNEIFSRWELEGYVSAARDDLDRAMDVVGRLMNTWKYFDYEDRVKQEGPKAMRTHKKESKVFWLPGIRNPIDDISISASLGCAIKKELERVLGLVRDLSNINEIPPYDAIKAGFQNCLDIIQTESASFEIECVPS